MDSVWRRRNIVNGLTVGMNKSQLDLVCLTAMVGGTSVNLLMFCAGEVNCSFDTDFCGYTTMQTTTKISYSFNYVSFEGVYAVYSKYEII